jgi:ABC-2 type transport system ATP-binding protein
LILDEPTSGLDPVQIVEMRQLIRSLRGQHTILLSSHNLNEISQTCDRLLVIHEGKIVAQEAESELAKRTGSGGAVEIEIAGSGERVPVDQALTALRAVPGVAGAVVAREVTGSAILKVDAPLGLRPKLVRALVQADVDVLTVTQSSGAGLESIFLKLTQGN